MCVQQIKLLKYLKHSKHVFLLLQDGDLLHATSVYTDHSDLSKNASCQQPFKELNILQFHPNIHFQYSYFLLKIEINL